MTTATVIKKRKSKARSKDATIVDRLSAVHWATWLLLFVILFFAVVRFRLRDIPLERDEGEYAYSGQLILQGIPPYELAYNMKLPGTYVAYALIMGVFGQSAAGIHTGLLLVNAVTSLMIFVLGKKLFGTVAGAFAGMCYALASASPVLLGFAAHAENFVVFAAAPGLILLLDAFERDSASRMFWAGTCFGIAFLMKQPGAVFAAFALVYFLYENREQLGWQYAFPRAGALLAGAVWPFALTCLVLYWAGVFRNFWFWTVSYASAYAAEEPLGGALRLLRDEGGRILPVGLPVLILALLGVVALYRNPRPANHRDFVIGLLLASAVGVCAGFYFRNHYFILLLPVISLLAGLALSSISDFVNRWTLTQKIAQPAAKWTPLVVFFLVFVIGMVQQRRFFFAANTILASNQVYADNPFLAAREIAKYLESSAPPEALITVLGSEPEIYFYSHRHSATGYVYTYGLVEDQQYASRMQQEMIQEITRAQPQFVVFVDNELSWLWKQGGGPQEPFLNWIQSYINADYTKTAQVDVGGNAGHLLGTIPRIYVFRRKPH